MMKISSIDEMREKDVFKVGDLNSEYANYFKGNSYLNMFGSLSGVSVFNVTFDKGCRNNWHIHHSSKGGGQILICTYGSGWYQEEGSDPISLEPGTVIFIKPNLKHWHGAKKDSCFSHIALEIPGDETSNEWCEEVTDEEYDKLNM